MSMAESLSAEMAIINERGLHARASAKVVELAETFECEARLSYAGEEADPRSIMELLTLGAACGETISVTASGSDAAEFIAALEALISSRFGEER